MRTLESLARIELGAQGGALVERVTTTRTAKDGTATTTVRERFTAPDWHADGWFGLVSADGARPATDGKTSTSKGCAYRSARRSSVLNTTSSSRLRKREKAHAINRSRHNNSIRAAGS